MVRYFSILPSRVAGVATPLEAVTLLEDALLNYQLIRRWLLSITSSFPASLARQRLLCAWYTVCLTYSANHMVPFIIRRSHFVSPLFVGRNMVRHAMNKAKKSRMKKLVAQNSKYLLWCVKKPVPFRTQLFAGLYDFSVAHDLTLPRCQVAADDLVPHTINSIIN